MYIQKQQELSKKKKGFKAQREDDATMTPMNPAAFSTSFCQGLQSGSAAASPVNLSPATARHPLTPFGRCVLYNK